MSNILVAYFSATGKTAAVAERLAKAAGADIFEITPVCPYTAADLEWRNPNSRSSLEMRDVSSRPQITGRVGEMSDYDTVFVGFPIWWYTAPTIINTFLEQYDLADKKVVPFATSGSSDWTKKANDSLAPSCADANLVMGKRFAAGVSEDELKKWVDTV